MWRFGITCSLAVLIFPGCSDDMPTIAELHDDQIERSWIKDRQMVDAVPFLENGGVYENTSTDHDIDGKYVLPLVTRLHKEFALDVHALLVDSTQAFAVIVDISGLTLNDDRRSLIVDAIQQTDDKFPGVLADKWGDDWLSLDLLDESEIEVFTDDDLEDFKQKIVAERNANRG